MNINWQLNELDLKVVYYGPALSGKTTNLEQIHARIDPQRCSELVSLKTHDDRTLYFDFLQIELSKISGLQPKIHLYTVPGQICYEASRRLVLRGADGVVFVADSTPDRLEANQASWEDLKKHLGAYHIPLESLPLVIQCNKQDLAEALSPEHMKRELSMNGFTLVSAAAVKGEGVFDTLRAITMAVITNIQQEAV
ncbi:MAG: ADP-ribosylation factor-like protein [Anaerolineaceae bacterium]